MRIEFTSDSAVGQALVSWWRSLEDDTGGRAQLRRARNETEVIMVPAFHRLLNQMRKSLPESDVRDPRWATIAGIAVHIRDNASGKLAEQMAAGPKGTPVVSELRFRRLLQRDRDDLMMAMVSTIRLLRNKASLLDMAASVYYWGEKVRRGWAFDYYPHVPRKQIK